MPHLRTDLTAVRGRKRATFVEDDQVAMTVEILGRRHIYGPIFARAGSEAVSAGHSPWVRLGGHAQPFSAIRRIVRLGSCLARS